MDYEKGDRVVNGFGRQKVFGTVERVINDFYMDVLWEDGELETVFCKDVRRAEK